MDWPTAFALTLALEIPVVWWMLRDLAPGWQRVAAAAAASGFTHPILWHALPGLFEDYWTFVIVGEAWVWATEALIYAVLFERKRGIAAAVAANALSMGVGLIWMLL